MFSHFISHPCAFSPVAIRAEKVSRHFINACIQDQPNVSLAVTPQTCFMTDGDFFHWFDLDEPETTAAGDGELPPQVGGNRALRARSYQRGGGRHERFKGEAPNSSSSSSDRDVTG